MVEILAFRRSRFYFVADQLVIPANPPEADKGRNPEAKILFILDAGSSPA
jgi:hypothetical protein